MPGKRINSINEIHTHEIGFEDIKWRHGVFQPISTGSGRNKQYSYWRGVQTNLGEIEEKLWYRLAESLIQKSGEQELLDALIDWESSHNYTRDSPQKIREMALRLHISRIFDDPCWVGFIPFNQKYRPKTLENAHLVTVVNECCGKQEAVTQEQIDHACDGRIACPHCGRWSHFSIPESEQEAEQGMEMM